ncbi:hypothetical protein M3I54_39505 [Paraburkholderia sp. CNPSo 3274]|uniref:hypothetical protein n=1 Tax=Paraburkholderia sp. CNPSo 3274 TaxID=2940932 RepID=UPI0020B6A1E3|nr:hypothetical protein [Paraburkholderia sp. CNPSo 3274]MCP3712913.1 hypothetical protein [Paraburkholderia sp. CNPSo 3274]
MYKAEWSASFFLAVRLITPLFVRPAAAQAGSPANDTFEAWIYRVFVAMRSYPDALNEGRILRLVNRHSLYRL